VHCVDPNGTSSVWWSEDGVHVDLRGLSPPEPMVTILRMIDANEVGDVVIGHFDREPVFLYPELDDRGWTHEVLPSECGDCTDGVTLRIARYVP